MTERVLIVEDQADIAELIKVNLADLAITTEHADDGAIALEMALEQDFDLILLDIMLPKVSGLDICQKVRLSKPEQAIIMLTSRNSEADRVVGLELGADDYLTKPFSIRELQARVRAQLRRVALMSQLHAQLAQPQVVLADDIAQTQMISSSNIELGKLTINLKKHQAFLDNQELSLTSTEFELLHFLALHPEQVFSREQLLNSVWGYQHSGYEHTVNSHINRLRTKLECSVSEPKIIQTVWGVGYKFNPQGVLHD
ncbi:response regulator transcription factor [Catenovulum sp. SM1970]|uniref:winged helix-turn-helix domain-containing protein n=1 Tax=Marinifaba aquimaris TaxID=2741323 RepID=UPI001572C1BE|nr:response regulator transcription factor [Marinifaba aquimaris]NTS78409.1 response regulator transcription factor [Marinifaba aquimaris]